MIQKFSLVNVVDNSGAQLARCIHLYGGYRQRYARVGDKILVSVLSMKKSKNERKSRNKEKETISKGSVVKGVLVRTKQVKLKNTLGKILFNENSIVLINEKNKFLSSRVFGGVMGFLRKTRFLRVTTMAGGVILT